jgi:hypothetical protein
VGFHHVWLPHVSSLRVSADGSGYGCDDDRETPHNPEDGGSNRPATKENKGLPFKR